MKRLTSAMFFTIIFFLWNTTLVVAQFKEVGVQKFETPVDAADFTLKELGGKEISLRELRGKVVVINFFTVD
jgi:cytochrome oxidase Cu insertion factor (SCO1/SenC/PrrC family)